MSNELKKPENVSTSGEHGDSASNADLDVHAEETKRIHDGEDVHMETANDIHNAAAMRQALKDTEELLEHFAKPGTMLHSAFYLHMRDNRAALSAPPRNCDRFTDEVDAQLAFLNEVWLISVTRETMLERDNFDNWTCEMRSEFARWLLATADGDTK